MSSISAILSTMASGSEGGDGSIASQITALSKQIQNVSAQMKELSDKTELTDEQKAEMQQMYESQITMLEAQIAQLEQKQAEQSQPESAITQSTSEIKADGINRPTDSNKVDVYIWNDQWPGSETEPVNSKWYLWGGVRLTLVRIVPGRGTAELRHDFEEVSPRVEYELSDTGMELLLRMIPLWTWIVENAERFREDKLKYEENNGNPVA